MTLHQTIHGRAGSDPNKALPEAAPERHAFVQNGSIHLLQFGRVQPVSRWEDGGWTFRAPRHGDLVVCPYCDADTFSCDHCGGERRLYANEVFK